MQSAFFKFVFSLWSSFKNYWQSPSNIRDAKCWNAFSFSGPKFSYQFWLATTWTTCESIKLRCNRMKDEVLWLRVFPANPCLRNIMYCIVATPGAIQCFLANEDATLGIGGNFVLYCPFLFMCGTIQNLYDECFRLCELICSKWATFIKWDATIRNNTRDRGQD